MPVLWRHGQVILVGPVWGGCGHGSPVRLGSGEDGRRGRGGGACEQCVGILTRLSVPSPCHRWAAQTADVHLSVGGWKSEARALACVGSAGSPFPGLYTAAFLLCPHMAEREGQLAVWSLLIKTPILSWGPPSWPHLNLITFQRPHC